MPLDGKENAPGDVSAEGIKETGANRGRHDDYAARVAQTEPLSEAGFKIIELRGKQPVQKEWQHGPGLDRDGVRACLSRVDVKPMVNVGAVLPYGWVLLDWDEKHEVSGSDSRKPIAEFLATCPAVASGSGRSVHYYARVPECVDPARLKGKERSLPAFDIKAPHMKPDGSLAGHLAVAPGSRHPDTGNAYAWIENEGRPALKDAPFLPADLVERLLKPARKQVTFDDFHTADDLRRMLFGDLDPEEALPADWKDRIGLDPEEFRDDDKWRGLGMSCAEATGEDPEAQEVFDVWSQLDPGAYAGGIPAR